MIYHLLLVIAMIPLSMAVYWSIPHGRNNKIDKNDDKMSERTRDIIKEIRDSNLDFHGRLSKMEGREERK